MKSCMEGGVSLSCIGSAYVSHVEHFELKIQYVFMMLKIQSARLAQWQSV